jgi:hypothetical protein
MSLLVEVKSQSIDLRNNVWEPLFAEVQKICDAKKIQVPSCCHMNQTGAESSYSKQKKPDSSVWQIRWSSFVDSDGSQGRR